MERCWRTAGATQTHFLVGHWRRDAQQPSDPFLDPEPLPAAHLVGGLNILAILAPARIIGVYDAIAASAKFGERR
jgi:hypothetical protein